MTFRARLFLASVPLALLPVAFLGLGVRRELSERTAADHAARVAALADLIEAEIARESSALAGALDRIAGVADGDARLRLALVGASGSGDEGRAYLLDWAERTMPLAGFDLLLLLDEAGRVRSSGHFRNEYDRVDGTLVRALAGAGESPVLVETPTATGSLLALARARPLEIGDRRFTLVGGTRVDPGFVEGLARGTGLEVLLATVDVGSGGAGAGAGATREVRLPWVLDGAEREARFVVRASDLPLLELRREIDRRLLIAAVGAGALALLLAALVSSQLARPLAELAERARRVDLERPEVSFGTRGASPGPDEVGALARVLDRMTDRLRAGAARLRDAERRATIGDVARQVNHDVKNGLVPIRNVVSHLAELAVGRPEEMQRVFLERQRTIEGAIGYLQTLAASYARLSPALDRQPCDPNGVARQVVAAAGVRAGTGLPVIETDLAPGLPAVEADPVALRRILENLVLNALESLPEGGGRVRVWTRPAEGEEPRSVLLGVTDTGAGMGPEERGRVFEDFFTTKPQGTGLGLSIVRRLVSDLGGRVSVESEPGRGTTFTVELPSAGPARPPEGGSGGDLRARALEARP